MSIYVRRYRYMVGWQGLTKNILRLGRQNFSLSNISSFSYFLQFLKFLETISSLDNSKQCIIHLSTLMYTEHRYPIYPISTETFFNFIHSLHNRIFLFYFASYAFIPFTVYIFFNIQPLVVAILDIIIFYIIQA